MTEPPDRGNFRGPVGDGSTRIEQTADGNPGWNPTTPTSGQPTWYTCSPSLWEGPQPRPGDARVKGYYRWSRGGLAAVDFQGSEINTGQF